MDDQKKDLIIPELVKDGGKASSRSTIIFTVLGVGMAFAVIGVVLGSLYMNKKTAIIQNIMVEEEKRHNIQNPYNTDEENITIRGNTEVYLQRDETGGIKSVAILDFDTDIYGVYVANTDECIIAIKDNSDILKASMATKHHIELNESTLQVSTSGTDYATVPEPIAELCKGKRLNWIQTTNDKAYDEPLSWRVKRQAQVTVCTHWEGCSNINLPNGKWKETCSRTCWYEHRTTETPFKMPPTTDGSSDTSSDTDSESPFKMPPTTDSPSDTSSDTDSDFPFKMPPTTDSPSDTSSDTDSESPFIWPPTMDTQTESPSDTSSDTYSGSGDYGSFHSGSFNSGWEDYSSYSSSYMYYY